MLIIIRVWPQIHGSVELKKNLYFLKYEQKGIVFGEKNDMMKQISIIQSQGRNCVIAQPFKFSQPQFSYFTQ